MRSSPPCLRFSKIFFRVPVFPSSPLPRQQLLSGACAKTPILLQSTQFVRFSPFSTSQILNSLKKSPKAAKAAKSAKGISKPSAPSPKPTTKPSNKQPTKTTSPSSPNVYTPPPQRELRYYSLADQLASKSEPTLLYKTSLTTSMIASYSIALFGLYFSFNTYVYHLLPFLPDKNNPSELQVPLYVPIISFIAIGLMSLITGMTIRYPSRMIRQIYALPAAARKTAGAAMEYPGVLHLKIEKQNFIPFLPYTSYTVPVSEITISRPIEPATKPIVQASSTEAGEQLTKTQFHKLVEFVAEAPFRFFKFTQRFLTREDVVEVRIKGSSNGLALPHPDSHKGVWIWQQESRILDRLVGRNKFY